jgi:hypothetical protein
MNPARPLNRPKGIAKTEIVFALLLAAGVTFGIILLSGGEEEVLPLAGETGAAPQSPANPPTPGPADSGFDSNIPPARAKGVLRLRVSVDSDPAPVSLRVYGKTDPCPTVINVSLRGHGGVFAVGAIIADYDLRVTAFGFKPWTGTAAVSDFNGDPIPVRLLRDLRLGTISVLLLDQDKVPVRMGSLSLSNAKEKAKEIPMTLGDDDKWSAADVPSGFYRVLYRDDPTLPGFKVIKFRLEPGEAAAYTAHTALTRITGTVLDRDTGAAVPNAKIFLDSEDGERETPPPLIVDGGGLFRSGLVPARGYTLIVRAPGYGLSIEKFHPRADHDVVLEIRLQQAKGILLEIDGSPDRLTFTLRQRRKDTIPLPLERMQAGLFHLDLLPGRHYVCIQGEGFPRTEVKLDAALFEAGRVIVVRPK